MKPKFTRQSFWLRFSQIVKFISRKIRGGVRRFFLLHRVLSKKEKIVFFTAFGILLLGLVIKSVCYYRSLTREVPAVGGTYSEALVGQPEFINPVLAKSDNDKTVSSLVYEGLIKLDDKNQIAPGLATSWEISPDQKSYTLHLRDGVTFQNSKPFDSDDVAYTFGLIQDPAQKSPLYNNFKDILIETPDRLIIRFSLKTPYGPFLTNLDVGIIPQGTVLSDLNKKPIGTGPYQYHSSSIRGQKVNDIVLERYENYYGQKPNIQKVQFNYYDTAERATTFYDQEEVLGLGLDHSRTRATQFSYQTSAKIMLFFNLRTGPFNDKMLRKSIQAGQKAAKETPFDLIVSDNQELVKAADDFKDKMAPLGYKVNVISLKETDFKERISKRDFQSLVVGIDFGHDFDPYTLWHSSQDKDGMNLSGFINKPADIILEDARQINDLAARQAKYNEFMAIYNEEAPALTLQDKKYFLNVDDDVKNVSLAGALTPSEHLRNIAGWYINTRRVKK